MNIVKNINQFNEKYVYYCDPINNNIINDGYFIRLIYSTEYFVLNGINLFISFNDVLYEKYYNKYKCIFNINNNKELLEKIKLIEENILKNANITNKIPQYKIYEQLNNGNIKFFSDNIEKINNNYFMLKISGLWERENQYGVTYKFIKINNC
jgi:hypothetical protein